MFVRNLPLSFFVPVVHLISAFFFHFPVFNWLIIFWLLFRDQTFSRLSSFCYLSVTHDIWRTLLQASVAEVLAREKPCIYPFKLNERLAAPRVREASLRQERRWEMTYNKAGLIVYKQERRVLGRIFLLLAVAVSLCCLRSEGKWSSVLPKRQHGKLFQT